ncbi:DUF4974 domain-containing protein [Muricauda sp. CAU 1633]|uniref:FecR family protein n=1 Tax=Allomuricauda sp. CAU 1633 TaxID=2816036 RepID=UPI001A903F69|nr:FecR family protein [Muricauda sp. CAU 1633]MBO0323636.1 DUF4974 domain-containing protein [Muricauda sp. CAU 1633]
MEIERIIIKFLNNEADIDELDQLDIWLRDENNLPSFKKLVRTEYLIILGMSEYDVNKAKKAIQERLRISKRKRKAQMYKKLAVAASIVLIAGSIFFQWDYIDQNVKTVSAPRPMTTIEVGSDKAILTLENGNQVALEKGKQYGDSKLKSDGSELIYSTSSEGKKPVKELQYNYLTIPRGGQFFVQLSDGTEVWLNSESKLKYPVEFPKNQTRQIELLYGEAYFKVSPSTAHNGADFQVLTKSQKIGVLGTEFNVKAYNEEDEIKTTLVEGKVNVQNGGESKILKPNQQSRILAGSDAITIEEVDVYQEVSWINGLFTFNEKSLGEIMATLSRWYDAEIIFENGEHKNFLFTGIIERSESIDYILKLIEATSEGQVKFLIDDKTITIR